MRHIARAAEIFSFGQAKNEDDQQSNMNNYYLKDDPGLQLLFSLRTLMPLFLNVRVWYTVGIPWEHMY